MQLTVSGLLNQFQRIMQGVLFPALQEQLGPLTGKMRQLIAVLNWLRTGSDRGYGWPLARRCGPASPA